MSTVVTADHAAAPLSPHATAAGAPWAVTAVLTASTFVAAGIVWDISWHMTIGRDTFWTPAHMMEYIGGLVAGLACGLLVLRTTFAGSAQQKRATVRFWGFSGPLGGWVAIWGTFAMLTSAPFDNWWHNAYGLDVKILSPPHVLLAIGIIAIQVGALLMTLAWQNRVTAGAAAARGPSGVATAVSGAVSSSRWLYAYAIGLLILMLAILGSQFFDRILMHLPIFYIVASIAFPFALVMAARSSSIRWPATTVAGMYTVMRLIGMWVLPLFPAHPKLGPIYQNVTHMVPPDFPLLIVVPAVAVDLVVRAFGDQSRWGAAALAGLAFLGVFVTVQWPFAEFLQRGPTQNWLFATNNYPYALPRWTLTYHHQFVPGPPAIGMMRGFAIAALIAMISARVGLGAGNWLRRVWR